MPHGVRNGPDRPGWRPGLAQGPDTDIGATHMTCHIDARTCVTRARVRELPPVPGRSLVLGLALAVAAAAAAPAEMPNACPVDGCTIRIVGVERSGGELELTLEANFQPDVAKNHVHVWWGDIYTVEQVGRSAETVHGVAQGRWHRHDNYPVYVTKEAASTQLRERTTRLCVSAADRDHNILDVSLYDCVDVAGHL